jgi:hypothetical protein
VVALIVICIALNGAGFVWHLFEPIPLYDEIAHFLTPFVLVAVLAEIIYRAGATTSSSTRAAMPSSRARS